MTVKKEKSNEGQPWEGKNSQKSVEGILFHKTLKILYYLNKQKLDIFRWCMMFDLCKLD